MRRWLWSSVAAIALGLSDLAAGIACASAELGKKRDIFDLRFDLGLWSIIVFLALFLILKKFAWKPILEGLQKREQSIRDAIADAKRAREEAQQMRAQLQQELNKAGEKVREILDEARREAQQLQEEMVSKARGEIQSERDRLRREIDLAKDQAIKELWDRTAVLATLISAKTIRRQLSEADHRQLVDSALAELQQAGTDWQHQGAGLRL